MEILLNGESVSFSLENEKTLLDIFEALSGWAGEQGARITAFEADGQSMEPSRAGEWGNMPLDGIISIAVSARTDEPGNGYELGVIQEYFDLFKKALDADDEKALREILKEYPYIRKGLEVHVKDIFNPEGGKIFEKDSFLLAKRDERICFTQTEKDAMKSYVEAAGVIVRDRLAEFINPEKEAANVSRLLLAAKPALENVPVLLQSGKDREAMRSILSYTELALKAIRILSRKTEGRQACKIFCNQFNGILNELTNAFEMRDSVLIGDLFEYEIAPRTDTLAELLAGGER
jgi:hypothetical protein